MMTLAVILFNLWFLWSALMLWLVYGRGAWRTAYNGAIAASLRRTPRMQAITLGARTYLADPAMRLSPSGAVHERFHYEQQWRRWPLTFVLRYLWENARVGYDKNRFENAARIAAGEPVR